MAPEKVNLDRFIEMNEPYGSYMIYSNGEFYSRRNKMILNLREIHGYNSIQIYGDGIGKNFYISDLVAEYFLPKDKRKNHV